MIGKYPGLPDEHFWSRERALAASLAGAYVLLGLISEGAGTAGEIAVTVFFPLMCVWYPDAIAHYTGSGLAIGSIPITRRSSEKLVRIVGWGFLALPLLWVAMLLAELRARK
jgi:hypothetical protein